MNREQNRASMPSLAVLVDQLRAGGLQPRVTYARSADGQVWMGVEPTPIRVQTKAFAWPPTEKDYQAIQLRKDWK